MSPPERPVREFSRLSSRAGGGVSASHLQELDLMGPEARTTLRRALVDGGELYLPEKLVLDLPEGGRQIYLPPSLLTPTASVRQGDITVEREEDWLRVSLDEDDENEDEDEDMDEDEDHGLTSDSSDDEEDNVFWGQEGGGPSSGGADPPSGPGGQRSSRQTAGRTARGRSMGTTREDQQVNSSRTF